MDVRTDIAKAGRRLSVNCLLAATIKRERQLIGRLLLSD